MTDITDAALDNYRAKHPPVPVDQWDDNACLDLAIAIIEQLQMAYISAKRTVKEQQEIMLKRPQEFSYEKYESATRALERARDVFYTPYFYVLSMGRTNPDEVVNYLDSARGEREIIERHRANRRYVK